MTWPDVAALLSIAIGAASFLILRRARSRHTAEMAALYDDYQRRLEQLRKEDDAGGPE